MPGFRFLYKFVLCTEYEILTVADESNPLSCTLHIITPEPF